MYCKDGAEGVESEFLHDIYEHAAREKRCNSGTIAKQI